MLLMIMAIARKNWKKSTDRNAKLLVNIIAYSEFINEMVRRFFSGFAMDAYKITHSYTHSYVNVCMYIYK